MTSEEIKRLVERARDTAVNVRPGGQSSTFLSELADALEQTAKRLSAAEDLANEAEIVAHGLDETCGKFPALEKALKTWRSHAEGSK